MMQEIKVQFPSNIALVKYWGKYGNQLPRNPSISLTLQKAYTELTLQLSEKKSKELEFAYFFEGAQNESFNARVLKYLQAQEEFGDLLSNYAIRVDSHNSFPHSTGIASSASAFSAIAAAFLKASGNYEEDNFIPKASHLARLGSGSACRSFQGPYTAWGKISSIPNSNEKFAVPVEGIHANFQEMRDAILIVEDAPKKVSSSVGHGLMKNHPFAEARFVQAQQHAEELFSTLKSGDYEQFVGIVEREALSLHAMMMTSVDYYLLMKPNTIEIMERVIQFRNDTHLPICFTLDAGPNIHLIYPATIENQTQELINNELKAKTKNILYDQNGQGGMFL